MDQAAEDHDAIAVIASWLIADARLNCAPLALIEGFCRRLLALGVPLGRLRAGQAIANPLASAWGVIWTRDGTGTHEYTVPRTLLATGAYHGSPFQHVIRTRQSFRRRLHDLDPERDHPVLHEMAAAGGTDYLALPLEYGDGSVQGLSLVADAAQGFCRSAPRDRRGAAPAARRRTRAERDAPLERQPAQDLSGRRAGRGGAQRRDQTRRSAAD
jgi:adenylate cyclase